MDEEKTEKLVLKNKLLESDNNLLIQKLKEKNKEINTVRNLYAKEYKKINEIKDVINNQNITFDNYEKIIDLVKEIINARWYNWTFNKTNARRFI